MSVPVIERIALNVVNTLAGVQVAGGYNQDLIAARPNRKLGDRAIDSLALVLQGSPEMQEVRPYQYVQWLQPFAVWLTAIESDGSDMPIDTRLNIMAGDCQRALMVDPQRDGWAIDTTIEPSDMLPIDQGATVGRIVVNFSVQYRTNYNDPFVSPFRT